MGGRLQASILTLAVVLGVGSRGQSQTVHSAYIHYGFKQTGYDAHYDTRLDTVALSSPSMNNTLETLLQGGLIKYGSILGNQNLTFLGHIRYVTTLGRVNHELFLHSDESHAVPWTTVLRNTASKMTNGPYQKMGVCWQSMHSQAWMMDAFGHPAASVLGYSGGIYHRFMVTQNTEDKENWLVNYEVAFPITKNLIHGLGLGEQFFGSASSIGYALLDSDGKFLGRMNSHATDFIQEAIGFRHEFAHDKTRIRPDRVSKSIEFYEDDHYSFFSSATVGSGFMDMYNSLEFLMSSAVQGSFTSKKTDVTGTAYALYTVVNGNLELQTGVHGAARVMVPVVKKLNLKAGVEIGGLIGYIVAGDVPVLGEAAPVVQLGDKGKYLFYSPRYGSEANNPNGSRDELLLAHSYGGGFRLGGFTQELLVEDYRYWKNVGYTGGVTFGENALLLHAQVRLGSAWFMPQEQSVGVRLLRGKLQLGVSYLKTEGLTAISMDIGIHKP